MKNYIEPSFQLAPYRRKNNSPPLEEADTSGAVIHNVPNSGWSGGVVDTWQGNQTYAYLITGQWTIPNPYVQPYTTFTQVGGIICEISPWIGLEDVINGTLFQAGADLDASLAPSLFTTAPLMTSIDVWWEWFPGPSVGIDFPLAFGDTLYCQLTLMSPTQGNIFMQNPNAGSYTQFDVQAPEGVTSNPTWACWIMEAPELQTDDETFQAQPSGYGVAYCDECIAVSANQETDSFGIWFPGHGSNPGPYTTLYDTVQSGTDKSIATIENTELLKFTTGPVGSVD
jgi:hypothetical protein